MSNVTDPKYWRAKLDTCGGDLQRAMYDGNADKFSVIHADQMRQLHKAGIGAHDSVLDVGCGYGRLLTLMPTAWIGDYVGIDISKDLLAVARILYPEQTRAGSRHRVFMECDATKMPKTWEQTYDVAIAVWLRSMLLMYGYESEWQQVELEMQRVARRVIVVW